MANLRTAVVLAALGVWAGARAADTCSLSGTVVDSVTGAGLSKVQVQLESVDRSGPTSITTTDSQGRYELANLPAGTYRLKGKRNGYLEGTYRSQLRLAEGQPLTRLRFPLTASAVIAGTVRDSDGEPLEGAHVVLGQAKHGAIEGVDSTDTDDRGEYRFRGLSGGTYYLSADARDAGWFQVDRTANGGPRERTVTTFYPGVSDGALAAPIEARAGKQVLGIDVTMARSQVYTVSGRVLNAPGLRVSVELRATKNARMQDRELRTVTRDAAGNFEFREVPPGMYELVAEAEPLSGRTQVVVGAKDVEGLRVPVAAGADVHFRVTVEGEEHPDLTTFQYYLSGDGKTGYTSMPFAADHLTARNVAPGHYALHVAGALLRQHYIRAARSGDIDVMAEGLTVDGPGTLTVDILLGSDGGSLEGMVRTREDVPATGATVVLLPERAGWEEQIRTTTSDQNGHYEFALLAPGTYRVLAGEDWDPEDCSEREFARKHERDGERVEVRAKVHAVMPVQCGAKDQE